MIPANVSCADFVSRVGFALRRRTLVEIGFDVEAALEAGEIVELDERPRPRPDLVRIIPTCWLPPRPERGGVVPYY